MVGPQALQRLAGNVLQFDEVVFRGLTHIVHGHHMRVHQRRGRAGFRQKHRDRPGLPASQFRAEHLDRAGPLEHVVLGQEDPRHAAAPRNCSMW